MGSSSCWHRRASATTEESELKGEAMAVKKPVLYSVPTKVLKKKLSVLLLAITPKKVIK